MDNEDRVPCNLCGTMILPATAAHTGGVCRPCEPRLKARSIKLRGKQLEQYQEFLQALHDTGWLRELSQLQLEKLHDDLILEFCESQSNPIHLLVVGYIVDECIENEGDYGDVIRIFTRSSQGFFRPTDITDSLNESEQTATVSFVFDGQHYTTTVPWEDDYFHPDVAALVNQALEDAGIPQRFFPLIEKNSPGVSLLFISEDTYAKAVDARLLSPPD